MSELINKAIGKLTDEMMAADNPAIQAIEEHLTKRCTSDAVAEKLLAEGKTLDGAFRKLEDVARSRKRGSCAYIPEGEAYAIVEKYFGIKGIGEAKPKESVNVLDLI